MRGHELEIIIPLLDGLLYPSESDEPVSWLCQPWDSSTFLSPQEFSVFCGALPSARVEERDPENFWSPVIFNQDWYGAEEIERTTRFTEIRRILEGNLKHIQYFEVGDIEVELYLVGHADGYLRGIKTTAICT